MLQVRDNGVGLDNATANPAATVRACATFASVPR